MNDTDRSSLKDLCDTTPNNIVPKAERSDRCCQTLADLLQFSTVIFFLRNRSVTNIDR
ncbi:hypothetical protein [Chroococcidiopsis sp [FACHB-1243]]|uniref:hypothetical protein n=1 Tax=Chroococcidiopsis sp. [FACHB-1243] TaxID=2692781 RepID=UPI001A7E5FF3|nr:hypothetical protein [Chroococcidiopsis sp. [FACHB-1243]]